MGCHAIHSWTFCGLVGAFLDLALASLLLCGSTLIFFASKFLGLLGLYLPCPFHGFFSDPNRGMCLQRLFVDYPIGKISSVQMSVKSNFPFDSTWMKVQGCQLNVKLVRDRDRVVVNGAAEMDGEPSCSSTSDVRRSQNLVAGDAKPRHEVNGFGSMNFLPVRQGTCGVYGNRNLNQKPSSGLRRHYRRAAVDYGKVSSVSSPDTWRLNVPDISYSPYSLSELRNEITEESSVPANSGGDVLQNDDGAADLGSSLGERSLLGYEVNKGSKATAELVDKARSKLHFDENEDNAIRVLEQSPEEELAALYLELEKERNAAATAADEAMAMILRLQKEKASIEMEARQYQRLIEEKSAYDVEEMNILKEILLRRERDKYFLEKEVEAYRQMLLPGNEQLEGDVDDKADTCGQRPMFSFDSSENPVMMMLQQINESIGNKEVVTNGYRFSDYEGASIEKQNCPFDFRKESPLPDWVEDAAVLKQRDIHRKVSIDKHHPSGSGHRNDWSQEFQEKGMRVSIDENPSSPRVERKKLEVDSELLKLDNSQGHKEVDTNFPFGGDDLGTDVDQGDHGPFRFSLDTEPSVHDVHVIDDKEKIGEGNEMLSTNPAFDRPREHDLPFEASLVPRNDVLSDQPSMSKKTETEPDTNRSSSDMTTMLPSVGNSRGKTLLSDLRRNSVSAIDNEMLKIDNEVGWLRDRLRIVEEGRERMSFFVEHREKEKLQLQLLEGITNQLREI